MGLVLSHRHSRQCLIGVQWVCAMALSFGALPPWRGQIYKAASMPFVLGRIASRESLECAAEVVCMKIAEFVRDFLYRHPTTLQ